MIIRGIDKSQIGSGRGRSNFVDVEILEVKMLQAR
jgi:hypothetical protein